MNKSAIKDFAVEARRNLLYQVAKKAEYYGITEKHIEPVTSESEDGIVIGDRVHIKNIKKQREDLVRRVKEKGYEQVMEEAAYTWFNRFIALRFMEVNDYLPTGVRVLSSITPDKTEPDIITSALSIDLPLDKEIIYGFQDNNNTEALYKYLLVAQCNELYKILPFLFEEIQDYTELLLPDNLLFSDSVIRKLTAEIPEEDFKEVEIIGWLYQFYISEKKDELIHAKKKYKTTEIPAVTQLFTPKWIVRYMVQNSLGRYWLESHPDKELQSKWEFYLECRYPQAEEKLKDIVDKNLKPEDITVFDPAMGSGHILIYAFEVLYEIYKSAGYSEKEIPSLILMKNLYGLDIDERATQLARFAVLMKARSYNRRILRERIDLNLYTIQETNNLTEEDIRLLAGNVSDEDYKNLKEFINNFKDAKTLGSIIKVREFDGNFLCGFIEIAKNRGDLFADRVAGLFVDIVNQAKVLSQKYNITITNPPYMGGSYMNDTLADYVKNNYPYVKSDLFSVFIELMLIKTKKDGHIGFIAPYVWMFIQSYAELRNSIIKYKTISSLIQLEYNAFEAACVPVATLTLRNYLLDLPGEYIKLSDFTGAENQPIKTIEAIKNPGVNYRYTASSKFEKIPGFPVAYWVRDRVRDIFENNPCLSEVSEPKVGLQTSNNNRFLRLWCEVEINKIGFDFSSIDEAKQSGLKWFPYNKGGDFRKWYGNNEYIVNWKNNGAEIKEWVVNNSNDAKTKHWSRRIFNTEFYFKQCATWSRISSSSFGVRYSPSGFIFDNAGCSIFINDKDLKYLTSFLCSRLAFEFLEILNPTITFQVGDIGKLPIIFSENSKIKTLIDTLAEECISISRRDWDSFETSWDFQLHPFIQHRTDGKISSAFNSWKIHTESQFNQLKSNEEELNRLFIEIYGLQDEMTPEVEDKNITIRKANLERDVKSFLSYAVGCMMGRYSLDSPGLIYAGGTFDPSKYKTYPADDDGIIPVLSADWFDDDIVARFIDFLRVTFGEDNVYENIDFIASALGKTDNETSRERIRKYFLNDFYKDHVRIYQKRPIYWLFTSGKNKAFNALIYLHRYDRTTIAKMRIDYLHELHGKLEMAERHLRENLTHMKDAREKKQTEKKLSEIAAHKDELRKYDELVRHMADMQVEIDLDDGVVVNYEKFKGLVAKI